MQLAQSNTVLDIAGNALRWEDMVSDSLTDGLRLSQSMRRHQLRVLVPRVTPMMRLQVITLAGST